VDSVERGEWKSASGGKRERTRYARYAKATFRKDRRLNIRLSSKYLLEAIQKWALAEGLPYQTLIASCCTGTRPDASKRSDKSAFPVR
jgi:predicted DNA binding CopG/RHH family protein